MSLGFKENGKKWGRTGSYRPGKVGSVVGM